MEAVKNYEDMSGLERTSLLMLALSEKHVSKLFSLMEDTEIREISRTMTKLGKVPGSIVETLLFDFVEQVLSSGSIVGSLESTRRTLMNVMPTDKVNSLLDEIRGPAGRTMWDKLSNINEELLANYLKGEYPQTISVVLSRIRPEHAAKVIALLPETLSVDVMLRMLRMENVRKDILDDIEKTLRVEFVNNLGRSSQRDSYETMADIFNYMDRANEARYLGALEERNGEAAERIRELMFTFDDIIRIDAAGVQAIIRMADKTKLSLALKGAEEPIKNLFFGNMSERAGKLMRDEIESLGMVRVRDVDDAQGYIVSVAKELVNQGEIYIRSGNEAEEQMIG